MKLVRNLSFWGLIISASALTLSQLPPIREWNRRQAIVVRISDRIGVMHAFGVPGFQMQVDISNAGNVPVALSGIVLRVQHPDKTITELKADTYLAPPSSAIQGGQFVSYPLTSIKIASGERWSEMVTFSTDFSPQLEEDINKVRLNISQDIFAAHQNPVPGPAFRPAREETVRQARDLFARNFKLQKGEYVLTFLFVSKENTTLLSRTYRMTMYEYHVATLQAQVEDYRYGLGITMGVDTAKQVWIRAEQLLK